MALRSSLEVLGVPKNVVAFESASTSSESDARLKAVAEGVSKVYSRHYHPDRNSEPGAASLYGELADAIADVRTENGMKLAIGRMVGEADRQLGISRVENEQREIEQADSLTAMLGLLQNIDQFGVLGIEQPTTYLLQLGSSRTILDVDSTRQATLSLTTQEDDVLPYQPETTSYGNGEWHETYLADESRFLQLEHLRIASQAVTVIGFVPASATRRQRSRVESGLSGSYGHTLDEAEGYAQLDRRQTGVRIEPVWSRPQQAWYLSRIVPKGALFSEVVVRRRSGELALAGSIQASAAFAEDM
jgi:hypothetical protein